MGLAQNAVPTAGDSSASRLKRCGALQTNWAETAKGNRIFPFKRKRIEAAEEQEDDSDGAGGERGREKENKGGERGV